MTNYDSMLVRVYFEDFVVNEYFGPYTNVEEVKQNEEFISHAISSYRAYSNLITSKQALNELWEIQNLKLNIKDDKQFEPYTRFPDLLHLERMGTIGHDFIMDGSQYVFDFSKYVTWEVPFGKCFWLRVAELDDWSLDISYFGPYKETDQALYNGDAISIPHADPAFWSVTVVSDEFRLKEEALPEGEAKFQPNDFYA